MTDLCLFPISLKFNLTRKCKPILPRIHLIVVYLYRISLSTRRLLLYFEVNGWSMSPSFRYFRIEYVLRRLCVHCLCTQSPKRPDASVMISKNKTLLCTFSISSSLHHTTSTIHKIQKNLWGGE